LFSAFTLPNGTSAGYFLRSHYDIAKLDTKRIASESIRKMVEGASLLPALKLKAFNFTSQSEAV
jgi:hypothetical protein